MVEILFTVEIRFIAEIAGTGDSLRRGRFVPENTPQGRRP